MRLIGVLVLVVESCHFVTDELAELFGKWMESLRYHPFDLEIVRCGWAVGARRVAVWQWRWPWLLVRR